MIYLEKMNEIENRINHYISGTLRPEPLPQEEKEWQDQINYYYEQMKTSIENVYSQEKVKSDLAQNTFHKSVRHLECLLDEHKI